MRLEFDPESGAFYICIREGDIEETLALAEPGFGVGNTVKRIQGNNISGSTLACSAV